MERGGGKGQNLKFFKFIAFGVEIGFFEGAETIFDGIFALSPFLRQGRRDKVGNFLNLLNLMSK